MPEEVPAPGADTDVDTGEETAAAIKPSLLTTAGKTAWRTHKAKHERVWDDDCSFCQLVRVAVDGFARQYENGEEKRKMKAKIAELEGLLSDMQINVPEIPVISPTDYHDVQDQRDAAVAEVNRLKAVIEEAQKTFEAKVTEEARKRTHEHDPDNCLVCAKLRNNYDQALAECKLAMASHAGCAELLAAVKREADAMVAAGTTAKEEAAQWRGLYLDLKKEADDFPKRKKPKASMQGTSQNEMNFDAPANAGARTDFSSSSAPTAPSGGGGPAATNSQPQERLDEGSPERPPPGIYRRWPWFEWCRYDLHHPAVPGALIHGVLSQPKRGYKASTVEHTLRGEMVVWASTNDLVGRDAMAKFFGTRNRYREIANLLGIQVNPRGKLERRDFTMDTGADEMTRWFAAHGLTFEEGEEMISWCKIYIERRWIRPSQNGTIVVPAAIRGVYDQIRDLRVEDNAVLGPGFERKEPKTPEEDTVMHAV